MRIRAFLERDKKWKTVRLKSGRLGSLLETLGINPEAVIAARGRELLAGCCPLREGERIRIIHIKASD